MTKMEENADSLIKEENAASLINNDVNSATELLSDCLWLVSPDSEDYIIENEIPNVGDCCNATNCLAIRESDE